MESRVLAVLLATYWLPTPPPGIIRGFGIGSAWITPLFTFLVLFDPVAAKFSLTVERIGLTSIPRLMPGKRGFILN